MFDERDDKIFLNKILLIHNEMANIEIITTSLEKFNGVEDFQKNFVYFYINRLKLSLIKEFLLFFEKHTNKNFFDRKKQKLVIKNAQKRNKENFKEIHLYLIKLYKNLHQNNKKIVEIMGWVRNSTFHYYETRKEIENNLCLYFRKEELILNENPFSLNNRYLPIESFWSEMRMYYLFHDRGKNKTEAKDGDYLVGINYDEAENEGEIINFEVDTYISIQVWIYGYIESVKNLTE